MSAYLYGETKNMNITILRLLQIFIIACLGFYALLIFTGNIFDYDSNYQFVKHVLAMDTVFPDNDLTWRAITNPTLVNLAYWSVIAIEGIVAVLAILSGILMLIRIRKSASSFELAKNLGFVAFILAFALWFVGFLCIGAEWFSMWQSSQWNGKQTAMDIVAILGPFLIIYMLPERIFTIAQKK